LEPFRARLASKFANSANLKEKKMCANIQYGYHKTQPLKTLQKVHPKKLYIENFAHRNITQKRNFSIPFWLISNFFACTISSFYFVIALFRVFEGKHARNGSKTEKTEFFKSCLGRKFCNCQKPTGQPSS
jgi:hypothetical protein